MKPSTLIKKYGWIQGEAGSLARGHCTLIAILTAYKGNESKQNIAINKMKKYLKRSCLVTWNDRKCRTKSQVIAALKAVGE